MADSQNNAGLPTSRNEVREVLKELISEALSVQMEKIEDDSNFIDDLGADSLDIVELVMLIENRFNIDIPDEEAEKIASVRDAIDHISDALSVS